MKRIEAIVPSELYPDLKDEVEKIGIYSLSRSEISSGSITSNDGVVGLGSLPFKGGFRSKVELIVSDKDARKVIRIISQIVGRGNGKPAKILVSSLEEIIDPETMGGTTDLESVKSVEPAAPLSAKIEAEEREFRERASEDKVTEARGTKRSRLVPLQKYTLARIQKCYESNREVLRSEYRIKSFSDFVNFCVLGYLPMIEAEMKQRVVEVRRVF